MRVPSLPTLILLPLLCACGLRPSAGHAHLENDRHRVRRPSSGTTNTLPRSSKAPPAPELRHHKRTDSSVILPNFGSRAATYRSWSEASNALTNAIAQQRHDPPPPPITQDSLAKERLCNTTELVPPDERRNTCKGEGPWIITATYLDVVEYHIGSGLEGGRLAVGPALWTTLHPPRYFYDEVPHTSGTKHSSALIFRVWWSTGTGANAPPCDGCSSSESNKRKATGICTITVDRATLAESQRYGDCERPPGIWD